MAEKQAAHRQWCEKKPLKTEAMGPWFAFLIVIIVLGVSVWLIVNGFKTEGTIIGVADLIALTTVFVQGSKARLREKGDPP